MLGAEAAEASYLLLHGKRAYLKSVRSLCKDEKHAWALRNMGKGTLRTEVQRYLLDQGAQQTLLA